MGKNRMGRMRDGEDWEDGKNRWVDEEDWEDCEDYGDEYE